MRLKSSTIVGIFLGMTAIAVADYGFFFLSSESAFVVHNILAMGIGAGLLGTGSMLWRKERGHVLHLAPILVGFTMLTVHATKLLGGRCF